MSAQKRRLQLLAGGVSASAILVASPCLAADPAPAAPDQTTLGELVVTAQRRAEALQDVPIAVSAFNQDMLEKKRVDTGPDLVLAVPNVTFAKSYFGGFNFQIRGVGTQLSTASGDSGVGIHLNDMPLTSSRFFEAEFFDVAQVEVLRGPQGTLYGRNATGGVVNVITAKPKPDFEALGTIEAGTHGTAKAKVMINLPLGEAFALRADASYLRRSGFGENTFTGENVNGRELYATRLTLGFTPSDRFEANLMWQHFQEADDRTRAGGVLCTKDAGPTSVGGVAVRNPITRGLLGQGCANASLYTTAAHGSPNSVGTLFGILPLLFGVASCDYNASTVVSADLNDTQSFFSPRYKALNDVVQLGMSFDVTPELTVSSLTGYLKDDVKNFGDFFGFLPSSRFNSTALTPGGVFVDPQLGALDRSAGYTYFTQPSRQFTQELRLQSDFDGPFNFSVGANYLQYKTTTQNFIAANVLTLAATALNGGAPCPLGRATCIYIDPSVTPDFRGHNYFTGRTPYKLTSEALFGEVYYNLSPDLKVTGGLRYTHDHKKQVNVPVPLLTPGAGLALGTPAVLVSDYKEPTGRLGFDWNLHPAWADHAMVYGFYSRGYKAGGSNSPANVGIGSVKANFDPEFVDAFEVGSKNTLLDGQLTLNVSAFSYNYKNYQVAEIVNRTQVVQNVNARVLGVELESVWRPTPNLQFDVTAGWLHSKLRDSASIDPINITNNNPALTHVKTSGGSNCAVPTAALANLVAIIEQQPGAPTVAGVSGNPTALLGVCGGAFAGLGLTPSEGEPTPLDGNRLPNAPGWTVSLGAQHTWDLRDGWTATLRGDFYAQGNSYARVYNARVDKLKGWTNVNATLTVADGGAWKGQVFVKNVFDKQPIVNTFLYDAVTGLYTQGFTQEPRIVGASLTRSF